MKTIMILAFFMIGFFASSAQEAGIYGSLNDFQNGELTYKLDCSIKAKSIRINNFFWKPYITIFNKNKTKSYNLQKSDVFAFRDCDGKIYRFIGRNLYTTLNPWEDILIYKHQTIASKNQLPITTFKFSKLNDLNDQSIYDLSIYNLKKAFPDNSTFHLNLMAVFGSDTELTKYDSYNKCYQLSLVYRYSFEPDRNSLGSLEPDRNSLGSLTSNFRKE